MKLIKQSLKGVSLLQCDYFEDNRGFLVKTFFDEKNSGLKFTPSDEYFSISKKNVLRGLHFQIPPYDHDKVVSCVHGSVLDVLLDLRSGPSFGNVMSIELSSDKKYILYIPKGIAHGFLSLENNSILHYKTSTIYSPSHDKGILWNSIDFDWPIEEPILSKRDLSHIVLSEYESPF